MTELDQIKALYSVASGFQLRKIDRKQEALGRWITAKEMREIIYPNQTQQSLPSPK